MIKSPQLYQLSYRPKFSTRLRISRPTSGGAVCNVSPVYPTRIGRSTGSSTAGAP